MLKIPVYTQGVDKKHLFEELTQSELKPGTSPRLEPI
jgi:hypothetical protein